MFSKNGFKVMILMLGFVILLFSNSVIAGKGGNGNGFPPGTHFNLNVIAKWSDNFTCPNPEPVYELSNGDECIKGETGCKQVFGNVIFIPREGSSGQEIDVVAGGKGKNSNNFHEDRLQVTDWCTEAFPESEQGTSASFFLPDNRDAGYKVYARMVGKPSKNGDAVSMTLIPDIDSVYDDCVVLIEDPLNPGNLIPDPELKTEECELLYLGSLDSDGVTVSRTVDDGSATKGKRVKKAMEVTDLFQFTGHVCLRPEDDFYQILGLSTDEFCNGDCIPVDLCCTKDVISDDDYLYESCGYMNPKNNITNNPLFYRGEEIIENGEVVYIDGEPAYQCKYPYIQDDTMCREYIEEWTFNIADVVNYFLEVKNNGGYVLQLRFYTQ